MLHGAVAVRRIMNLSSSFDHRFVDGFDAAAMIQSLNEGGPGTQSLRFVRVCNGQARFMRV